jgi:hypothetical protein
MKKNSHQDTNSMNALKVVWYGVVVGNTGSVAANFLPRSWRWPAVVVSLVGLGMVCVGAWRLARPERNAGPDGVPNDWRRDAATGLYVCGNPHCPECSLALATARRRVGLPPGYDWADPPS